MKFEGIFGKEFIYFTWTFASYVTVSLVLTFIQTNGDIFKLRCKIITSYYIMYHISAVVESVCILLRIFRPFLFRTVINVGLFFNFLLPE